MTKKQIIYSLRLVLSNYRDICDRKQSHEVPFSPISEYYKGKIDAVDYVLELLCNYE